MHDAYIFLFFVVKIEANFENRIEFKIMWFRYI